MAPLGPIPTRTPSQTSPRCARNFAALNLDALVVIGGDDTLGVAVRLYNDFQWPVVGIPKTIDNDLTLTDFSFGFDTAVNVVTEAVDRLRTTTESHRRVMVIETMGRHSGWIACFAGMAVGADYILVPEVPIDLPHLLGVLTRRAPRARSLAWWWSPRGRDFPIRSRWPWTCSPTPSAMFAWGVSPG